MCDFVVTGVITTFLLRPVKEIQVMQYDTGERKNRKAFRDHLFFFYSGVYKILRFKTAASSARNGHRSIFAEQNPPGYVTLFALKSRRPRC